MKSSLLAFSFIILSGGCVTDNEPSDIATESSAISGGTVVPVGELEAVGVGGAPGRTCTATLVGPNRALTAARCVCPSTFPRDPCHARGYFALTNVVRRDAPTTPVNEDGTRGDVVVQGDVVVHPLYEVNPPRSDYAIIQLDADVTSLARVNPLPVDALQHPRVDDRLTMVGHGWSENASGTCGNRTVGTKRKASLPLRLIVVSGPHELLWLNDHTRHLCNEDWGGPLIDDEGRVVGVASSGDLQVDSIYGSTARIGDWLSVNGVAVPGGLFDQRPGLVWREPSGQVTLWFVDGASASARSPAAAGSEWTIVGTGDFNGDRGGDLLWRSTTGQVALWLMTGGIKLGEAYPGGTNAGWNVQGVGDFDSDDRSDILWRSTTGDLAIWFSGDTQRQAYPGVVSDTGWQVRGTGDFNGDTHDDVVWRYSNGQVAIWFMRNGSKIGEAYPGGQDGGGYWSIAAIGDLDGDERDDILWRGATGELALWPQADANRVVFPSRDNAGGPGDLSWSVVGVVDTNENGRADIIWRHTSGSVVAWRMNGGTFVDQVALGTASSAWSASGVMPGR
jgi:hypothetical protein